MIIQNSKSDLEKYIFYYDRFQNNKKAEILAKKSLEKMKEITVKFHDILLYDLVEIEFLCKSTEILIECRRVLKWTYAYGFFLINKKEKCLFEFHQADFDRNCEILHELIERDFSEFYLNDKKNEFFNYKSNLINYADCTKRVH